MYIFVWVSLDRSYRLTFSPEVYEWLDGLLDVVGCEKSEDVAIWSTAIAGTLVLHAVAWVIIQLLEGAFTRWRAIGSRWRRRVSPVIGWTSWLLVLTLVIAFISDEVQKGTDGSLPTHTGTQLTAFYVGVFCTVGLIHLAVLRFQRPRS